MTGLSFLIVWSALLAAIALAGPRDVMLLHTVGLLVIALVAYAWVLYPASAGAALSVLALIAVAWSWGVSQEPLLAWDIGVLGALVAVAGVQRRRWTQRYLRLQRVLDDLDEERVLKDQALSAARQSRDALQKKHHRYGQLQAVAERLSGLTDLESIGQLAVEQAFALIGKSDVCLLYLLDVQQQELSLFASKRRETVGAIRTKHGDQFDRYVLRTQRPLMVNDVRRDFRFTVTVSADRQTASVIACPLVAGHGAEGVLRLDSARPGSYTQDDLRLLDILLNLIATGITNARLFGQTQRLAMQDGLTNLLVRRTFMEQLTRELTRAGRSREPTSLLMIDVDRFKDYNDAHGHTAGDLVLRRVAEILQANTPDDAVAARYGGEEFAVLLPRTGRPQAADLAETIRRQVESQLRVGPRGPAAKARESAGNGEAPPVTVSVGVASCPDDAQADMELIRMADQRLYQAKGAGRNVVCAT